MKKFISILLSGAIALGTAGVAPAAAIDTAPAIVNTVGDSSGPLSGTMNYTLSGGVLTISGTGPMPNFENYNYLPWKNELGSIRSVVIGEGVTTIGVGAFYNCTSLSSVSVPSTVTDVYAKAFSGCTSLSSITLPNVSNIAMYAFVACSGLRSVTIGNPSCNIRTNSIPPGATIYGQPGSTAESYARSNGNQFSTGAPSGGDPVATPTQPPTEAPTQPPTQPPTEPPTEPPTPAPTQPPTEPPTEPPTQPPTEPPTEPPTQPPTEPPTEPPTQEPTQAPTEAPTESPTVVLWRAFDADFELVAPPSKTTYTQGEQISGIDLSGMQFRVAKHYQDGTGTEEALVSYDRQGADINFDVEYTPSGLDINTPGRQTVSVNVRVSDRKGSFVDFSRDSTTFTYEVEVRAAVQATTSAPQEVQPTTTVTPWRYFTTDIELVTPPSKNTYTLKEFNTGIDLSGMQIRIIKHYQDGTGDVEALVSYDRHNEDIDFNVTYATQAIGIVSIPSSPSPHTVTVDITVSDSKYNGVIGEGGKVSFDISLVNDEVTPPAEEGKLGDVNEDGLIDAGDASEILADYANVSTGGQSRFSEKQKKAADVNEDGMCDSSDASLILSYYAYSSTTVDSKSMKEFLSGT